MVHFESLEYVTGGGTEIRDITEDIPAIVRNSIVREGQTGVYVAAITKKAEST